MSGLYNVLGVLFAILLRIGIPLGITILLTVWLRRLDVRWKAEAAQHSLNAEELLALSLRPPCWEFLNCPVEQRDSCPAYNNPKTACWQLFREPNGFLKQECLSCSVFTEAPQPFMVQKVPESVEIAEHAEGRGEL